MPELPSETELSTVSTSLRVLLKPVSVSQEKLSKKVLVGHPSSLADFRSCASPIDAGRTLLHRICRSVQIENAESAICIQI